MDKMSSFPLALDHFHRVATEPCSVIVLTETEFEILLTALYEFENNHTYCPESKLRLSSKGVDIVNSLYYHLQQYYLQLKK